MNRRTFLKISAVGVGSLAAPWTLADVTEEGHSGVVSELSPAELPTGATEQLTEWHGWIMDMPDKLVALEEEIEALRAAQPLNPVCSMMERELETTQALLDEVLDSRSWRITQPLRSAMDWFRNR